MATNFASILQPLHGGLIVSCQAPPESPLHAPPIIAAMATAAINRGAVGLRLDTPAHVQAVRQRVTAPIIGLWKQVIPGFEVYITPQFHHAAAIAHAGADIIAIDATLRPRPHGETVPTLIQRIHAELGKPVMADVDTLDAAIAAVAAGADLVGTTLFGYTAATKQFTPPGLELLRAMVNQLDVPCICEGGIASSAMAQRAIALGADAVVVGTAITGIDLQVQHYAAVLSGTEIPGTPIQTADALRYTLVETLQPAYRQQIQTRMREYFRDRADTQSLYQPDTFAHQPLDLYLLDDQHQLRGGLVGQIHWQWLEIKLIWVDEPLQRQGHGRRLMALAEATARDRGCQAIRLSTLSFQARDFYETLGYRVVSQLDDYPPGHCEYILTKSLTPTE